MRRPKQWTLDDGSVWTASEVAAETGVSKQSALLRLNRSRKAGYVLAPKDQHMAERARTDKHVDGYAVLIKDKNSAPDGHWFVGAYGRNGYEAAEKLAAAQGKSGFVRAIQFVDDGGGSA